MDPNYRDSTIEMVLNSDGLYEWRNYPNTTAKPAEQNRFSGQTFILTDNFTYSCSGMFSSLMREHTNALFAGEETGATQCGSAGMVAGIELPHSGVKVHFSTGKYVAQVTDKNNSRGVLPDIIDEKILYPETSQRELLKILGDH